MGSSPSVSVLSDFSASSSSSSSSKALVSSSPSLSSFLIDSPRGEEEENPLEFSSIDSTIGYTNQYQIHNTSGIINQHHTGKVAQLTAIGHTNQHQQHTTIGSTDQHDSNKFIPSSSPVTSSSFKSVHDIAPVMESYGLRQRRGRETQRHAQNENIDDGFQESCHTNDGSWPQTTCDGFQESCHTNDGSWPQNTYDGFQESCHTNDGSWPQNTYNLDEQNDSDEEEDDGDGDEDGGKAHRKLHMNAHNKRDKHAKNPNDDDDEDDDDDDNANDNEHGDDDDEREGNQKSPPSSSSIQKEDVSSSSSSSKPPSRKEEEKKKKKKKKLWHDYMCCRCASRFTVDCAAVCCCPLALVHLAALTFIRLPASLLWRLLVNLKSRMCVKRPPTEDMEFDEGSSVRRRPNGNFHNGKEDEGLEPSSHRIIRFESQKLWQHFGTGDLDFGGFTMRGD